MGAGEQVSGTPFSSGPFCDDTGHPCSVGQLLAWGRGVGTLGQSSLLVPRSTAANPKGLAKHDFILLSQQPWEMVLITQVYRERNGLRGGEATGRRCRLELDGLQPARPLTPRAKATASHPGVLSHTQERPHPSLPKPGPAQEG